MISKKKILDHEIGKIISVLKRSLFRSVILILVWRAIFCDFYCFHN